jgi:RNA polymerase sigma-70 factor (ECF subfamily)
MTGIADWSQARSICLAETRRVLRDSHAAEDAAQEALLRAWNARETCRAPDAAAGWLRRIAGNEARRLAARRLPTPTPEADLARSCAHVEQQTSEIALEAMLAQLPERERELVRLRYVSDLTQPQIAERLGVPEGTVKVRLSRSRAKLRTLMAE